MVRLDLNGYLYGIRRHLKDALDDIVEELPEASDEDMGVVYETKWPHKHSFRLEVWIKDEGRSVDIDGEIVDEVKLLAWIKDFIEGDMRSRWERERDGYGKRASRGD